MTSGDWIALTLGGITFLGAGVGWLTATYKRIGEVLYEVKYVKKEVNTLASAYDNQDKRVNGHEVRLATLSTKVEELTSYVHQQHNPHNRGLATS